MERGAITIRRAARRDIPTLLRLYGGFAAAYGGEFDLSPGEADAIFDRIDADSNQALLVAEMDLRVIGTLVLVVVPNMAHGGQPWAIVENVIVTASERRSGVGAALMSHLLSIAREGGCYKVQLLSAPRRQAHTFYESLGFEQLSNGFKLYLEEAEKPA